MPHLVLTTRPVADASYDIDWLAEKGIHAISAPMLEIKPFESHFPNSENFDAVVLTSRHAAKLMAGQELVQLPCFCIGEATAQEAMRAGFTKITTGPGDGIGLRDTITTTEVKSLYWPSAVDKGFDIANALINDDIVVTQQSVYKAAKVSAFPSQVQDALIQGKVAVVLAHSGRAGAHFTTLMERSNLSNQLKSMTMIAISTRAAGLCRGNWHTITVVDQPRRKTMLEAAMVAIRQLDNET